MLAASLCAALAFPKSSCHGQTSPAAAAEEAALVREYNDAMGAFQVGDYTAAAAKLENIVAKAGEGAQLEAVYFTLGACYFNLEQYEKAIGALKKYESSYPKGARLAEVRFSIGQASLLIKDFPAAAAAFAFLENIPLMREQALFHGASALKQGGQPDEAIKKLEVLISPEIKSSVQMNGAMLLAGLYGEKKETERTNELIGKILDRLSLVENFVQLNALAMELGDNHLASGNPEAALAVYRVVRAREEVIRFQEARVADAQKKLDDTLGAMRADPKGASQYLGKLPQLREDIARAKGFAEQARKRPDFTAEFDLRLGRCFYELGKRWESLVAYGDILDRFPDSPLRETALFASVVDYAELNRAEPTRRLGEQYSKEFPKGANADTAGYLIGATALQANDPQTAEASFGRMLKEQPGSSFAEQMRFLLGNAKFAQGKYEEALKDYQQYRSDYPKGSFAEEAQYRAAVSLVFVGKYEQGLSELERYLEDHPKGSFAPDARYRRAVCLYAAQQYDDVIIRCRDWEKDYSNDPQLGEVLSLMADSEMAKGATDSAIESYLRASKAATTDEVLSYSIFEAQKAMQKKGDWERISTVFQEFVHERPTHSLVPMATYWIAKASAHEGKVDDAKKFLADTIAQYINDPRQPAVEQLLTQLAQLCARKPAPSQAGSPTPNSDPVAELATLLGGGDAAVATTRARNLFAQSELARFRRQPAEQARLLDELSRSFSPVDLSAPLLAQAGDRLLDTGNLEQAEKFYQALLDTYPRSDVADFAYAGLGEIAYRRQDYRKALNIFDDAIDRGLATQKVKELTVGRAKALLALGHLDEAQKLFEQVASVREWRGDATAFAMYSLGEIEFRRGKWAEANAFFQRVFVAYQKFLPWVAKSYLASAACFERLGQAPEATRTLQEMLRNEKLAGFAEAETARKRLQSMQRGPG